MKPASRPPGTKQILFTFPRSQKPDSVRLLGGAQSTLELSAPVYRPFLPLGLFVWGATSDTLVSAVLVGPQHEASQSCEPIPARYFSEGRSMEELQRLADAGELSLSVEQRRVIEMAVAEVGQTVTVRMTGPFEDVCLWGLTYSQQWPLLTQRISPSTWIAESEGLQGGHGREVSGFHGRVIEHHLGGDRVISNVYAPSEQSVAQLLSAARRPERLY